MTPRFPRTAADRGKIAPARFAHCVVRTTTEHYAELVDWYRTLLEAEPVFENSFLCFMTYDDEHHRIAIAGIPGLFVARNRILQARDIEIPGRSSILFDRIA